MNIIQALGLVAAVACLLAYYRGGRVFDWANATLWPIVATASFMAGAWGALLLNLGFGIVGIVHLVRTRPAHVSHKEAVRKARIRAEANKVLLDAADGEVLYYRPPGDVR